MILATAKNLGGIGALLLVIGGLAFFANASFGGLLAVVGAILVLIALKGFADNFNDGRIFNNGLYSLVTIIVGAVVFIASLIASILYFIANLPDWIRPYIEARDWQGLVSALQRQAMNPSSFGSLLTLIGAVLLALVVLFVFVVLSMFFLRRSLGNLSTKTGVRLFRTSGLLLLIGAALTPILIGFFLIWIGWILLTAAFFSVNILAPTQPSPTMTPATT